MVILPTWIVQKSNEAMVRRLSLWPAIPLTIYLTHLVHLDEVINIADDQKAGYWEIKHFSHLQHNLILNNEELIDNMRCEACMQ